MSKSRFAAVLAIVVGIFAGSVGLLWGQAGGPFTAPANKVFMGPSVGEAWISRGSGVLVTAAPGAVTGTTSLTNVMAGVGSTCSFTPKYSTAVEIVFHGNISNATGTTNGATASLRFGTGTAPANGAAVTGSALGPSATFNPVTVAGAFIPFTLSGILSTVVIGTTYWVDPGFAAVTAGTANLSGLACHVHEIP